MNWLQANAGIVNLAVSALVLIAGLTVYGLGKVRVFRTHDYTRRAFDYWLLQWFGFLLIFILFNNRSESALRWLLAAVDLQSVFALGFFWTFLYGRDHRKHQTATVLVFTYLFLFLWNLLLAPVAFASDPNTIWRSLWIVPSQIISATALGLVAVVMYLRYGQRALPFGITAVVYILLQRPVYASTFLGAAMDPAWLVALAVGKLLYAGIFYTVFFFPVRAHAPLHLAAPSFLTGPQLRRAFFWLMAVGGGALLDLLTDRLSRALQAYW
jgi:hypothetical protein